MADTSQHQSPIPSLSSVHAKPTRWRLALACKQLFQAACELVAAAFAISGFHSDLTQILPAVYRHVPCRVADPIVSIAPSE